MKTNSDTTETERNNSEALDPEKWEPVNVSRLTDIQREKFNEKKRALLMYTAGKSTISDISKKTKLSSTSLFKLIKRAKIVQTDGSQAGYLACLPNYRLKTYTRTSTKGNGTAGLISQFLNAHPDQKKQLDDLALGKKKLNDAVIRGAHFKALWLKFREICESTGVDVNNEYPFTNADGGREAIRRYVNKIRDRSFVTAARIKHGDAAGRLAAADASLDPPVTLVPYQRVQLDAHSIDMLLNVRLQDPQGNEQDLPLSRIWLLALVCVASRAVIGYSLSLLHNYSSNDVLDCFANAFGRWEPFNLPENSLPYHDGAGLPNGLYDECYMRAFDSIQMDNAWSQLSQNVQERIINAGAIEVITNRPCTPRANAFVERLFSTLESTGFHQFPNTTGASPSDPRRRSPEKAAARLNIQYDDIKMITDVVIANYNAKSHSGVTGRSPLEYIKYRLSKEEDLLRQVDAETLDDLKIYEREFSVTVKANLSQGHKPYIQFKGVRYTGPKLQLRYNLKQTRCTFRVNTKDIRHGYLFDNAGKCIDKISAEPRWLLHKHSISTRVAINKLIKDKELSSSTRQPVSDHLKYIATKAPLSRKDRNKLVSACEQLKSDPGGDIKCEEDMDTVSKQKRRMANRPRISINQTFSR